MVQESNSTIKPKFEFPLTIYDRPSIAFANMLEGNVDATTKAIFSPMELSPDEMKNVRQAFLGDTGKDSTLISTAVDLATNPMVILGLIMSVGLGARGSVASASALYKMWNGVDEVLLQPTNPLMRSLTSAFTGLRDVAHRHVWPMIGKLVQNDQKFRRVFTHVNDKALTKLVAADKTGLGLTKHRSSLVTFWLEEMHKLPTYTDEVLSPEAKETLAVMLKGARNAKERAAIRLKFGTPKPKLASSWVQGAYSKHFGKEVPMMGRLEAAMNAETPALLEYAKTIRKNVYDNAGKMFFESGGREEITGVLDREMAQRGVERLGSYSHRIMGRFKRSLGDLFQIDRQTRVAGYKQMQKTMARAEDVITGRQFKSRAAGSIPHMDQVASVRTAMLEKHGIDIFSDGMYDKFTGLAPRLEQGVKDKLTNLVQMLRTVKYQNVGVDPVVNKEARAALGAILEEAAPSAYSKLHKLGLTDAGTGQVLSSLINAMQSTDDILMQTIDDIAGIVGSPSEFITHSDDILRSYIASAAPTYAWYSKHAGNILGGPLKPGAVATTAIEKAREKVARNIQKLGLGEALKEGLYGVQADGTAIAGPRIQFQDSISNMADDLIPMLRGTKHWKQFARDQRWRDSAVKFRQMLDPETGSVMAKLIPESSRQWLLEAFSGARGGITESTIGGKIAGLMYTSALGLNMSPISKNVLQPLLTTLPITGSKNLAKGMGTVAKRLTKYPALAKKIGSDRAFKKLFPGYMSQFGDEHILGAMAQGDIAREGKLLGKTSASLLEKGKEVLMAPFAGSEKWNRLVSFYAGQHAGMGSGLTKLQAREFAGQLTGLTQFTGGTLGQAQWARGVSAPLRQFGHFPTRYLEYLYATMRMGTDPQTRSAGALGRSMVTSAALYTIAKNALKVDISGGLMVGAMPGPSFENAAFYPAPFVPPAISAMGDVIKAFHSGDFSRLGSTAALLTPGGLAGRRAWRTFHPKFADYGSRTPDGRIPVYNDSKALIGAQTPMELTMRGLGLKPTSAVGEQQMTKYLLSQRDKIRVYRRQYLDTLAANNLEKARQINADFQKDYPSLGPLTVRKSDLTAVKNRQQISRLNRVMKGLPSDYRPLFQSMVEQATLSKIGQNIDTSPNALENFLQ